MTESVQQKVVVLGGGIGGLTTAWELQKTGQYDITVHQMGWRLGGKCATGRDPDCGQRLEEHGIHGFLGSYYNALEMMAEIFEVLAKLPDNKGFITQFDDAFDLQNAVAMWDYNNAGWQHWTLELPKNKLSYANPGDLAKFERRLQEYLRFLGIQLGNLIRHSKSKHDKLDKLLESAAKHFIDAAETTEMGKLAQLILKIADMVWKPIAKFIEARGLLDSHADIRHAFVLIDLGLAALTGFFADKIAEQGFDVIDHLNFADWLAQHGAHPVTLGSPLTLNTIALSYQFPDGDTSIAPQMSAASFLDWNLRQFAYLGAFGMLFTAGTGETIVAPMYKALKAKGVKFQFFSKVENVSLSADKTQVETIDLAVQAQTKDGGEYDPLVGPIKDLQCWPNRPKYKLLKQGDALAQGHELESGGYDLESYWTRWQAPEQRQLRCGEDFDHVVLAISIGALPYLCSDMMNDEQNQPVNPDPKGRTRWQAMVDQVPTVQTQAMQLWFTDELEDLGLPSLPDDNVWIAGTYVNPMGGQVDFSRLLNVEDWPSDNAPKGLLYICGTMPDSGIPAFTDHAFPAAQHDRVRYQCIQYLGAASGPLLANATVDMSDGPGDPIGLNFGKLHSIEADAAPIGAKRFETQFWRANIDPTERYVTSPPGSAAYRLKAGDSGYSNLYLAGDWIYTGLNVGSVEGTCMGGRLASNALSGSPKKSDIHGYDPFGLGL